MAPKGKGDGEVGKGIKCVGLDVNVTVKTYNTLPFMIFVEPYIGLIIVILKHKILEWKHSSQWFVLLLEVSNFQLSQEEKVAAAKHAIKV